LDQEIGELNREKNAMTRPVSQIPGYATVSAILCLLDYTTPVCIKQRV